MSQNKKWACIFPVGSRLSFLATGPPALELIVKPGKPNASSISTPSWKVLEGFLRAFWKVFEGPFGWQVRGPLKNLQRPLQNPSVVPDWASIWVSAHRGIWRSKSQHLFVDQSIPMVVGERNHPSHCRMVWVGCSCRKPGSVCMHHSRTKIWTKINHRNTIWRTGIAGSRSRLRQRPNRARCIEWWQRPMARRTGADDWLRWWARGGPHGGTGVWKTLAKLRAQTTAPKTKRTVIKHPFSELPIQYFHCPSALSLVRGWLGLTKDKPFHCTRKPHDYPLAIPPSHSSPLVDCGKISWISLNFVLRMETKFLP